MHRAHTDFCLSSVLKLNSALKFLKEMIEVFRCYLQVRISPDQTRVISVGEEGAILIWDYKPPIASTPPDGAALVKSPPRSPK